MKKAIYLSVLVSQLVWISTATADVCDAFDLGRASQIRTKIIGLNVTEMGGPQPKAGIVVDVAPTANSNFTYQGQTYFSVDLQLSNGQVISGEDLAELSLDCGSAGLINLAGALKNSGVVCTDGEFVKNIPNAQLNLDCKPVQ